MASTPTVTSVADSASSVAIIGDGPSRKGLVVQNDSASPLYLRFGTGNAVATDYSVKLSTGDVLSTPYNGPVQGIWDTAVGGFARVTELT